jgi:hypothetical protein
VWFVLTLAVTAGAGCTTWSWNNSGEKDLTIRSRANPEAIAAGGFDRALYSHDGPSSITVLLADGPFENPDRAMIVRMFWMPRAAATPLDETATNATVQYIVFREPADGTGRRAVGIYSGGGFLYPENDIGHYNLQANLWQATLNLADASEGFEDTLGSSILSGRFVAVRDDEAIVDAVRRVNIAVSESLGVPRFVRAD